MPKELNSDSPIDFDELIYQVSDRLTCTRCNLQRDRLYDLHIELKYELDGYNLQEKQIREEINAILEILYHRCDIRGPWKIRYNISLTGMNTNIVSIGINTNLDFVKGASFEKYLKSEEE